MAVARNWARALLEARRDWARALLGARRDWIGSFLLGLPEPLRSMPQLVTK